MKTQATLSAPSAVPGSPLLQVSGALFGIIAFILHTLPPAPVTVEANAQAPADFQSVMKSLLKRPGRS